MRSVSLATVARRRSARPVDVAVAVAGARGPRVPRGRRVARAAGRRRPARVRARRGRVHRRLADRLAELRSAPLRPDRVHVAAALRRPGSSATSLWLVGAVAPKPDVVGGLLPPATTCRSRPGRWSHTEPVLWYAAGTMLVVGGVAVALAMVVRLTTRRRSSRPRRRRRDDERFGHGRAARDGRALETGSGRPCRRASDVAGARARPVARAHRRSLDASSASRSGSACTHPGSCPTRSSTPTSRGASRTATPRGPRRVRGRLGRRLSDADRAGVGLFGDPRLGSTTPRS